LNFYTFCSKEIFFGCFLATCSLKKRTLPHTQRQRRSSHLRSSLAGPPRPRSPHSSVGPTSGPKVAISLPASIVINEAAGRLPEGTGISPQHQHRSCDGRAGRRPIRRSAKAPSSPPSTESGLLVDPQLPNALYCSLNSRFPLQLTLPRSESTPDCAQLRSSPGFPVSRMEGIMCS
jgi:hypothetical protein